MVYAVKNAVLRLPGVKDAMGKRTTAVYADIKGGLLTPPVKQGRSSFWPAGEVDAILAARIAGKPDSEIRALVKRLLRARTRTPQRARKEADNQAAVP